MTRQQLFAIATLSVTVAAAIGYVVLALQVPSTRAALSTEPLSAFAAVDVLSQAVFRLGCLAVMLTFSVPATQLSGVWLVPFFAVGAVALWIAGQGTLAAVGVGMAVWCFLSWIGFLRWTSSATTQCEY